MMEGSFGPDTGKVQLFLDKHESMDGIGMKTCMPERDGVLTT